MPVNCSSIIRCPTIIVESPQNSTGRLSEEAIVDIARAVSVTFRGLSHSHQASHSNGSRFAAVTERDPAKNPKGPQRRFEVVMFKTSRDQWGENKGNYHNPTRQF